MLKLTPFTEHLYLAWYSVCLLQNPAFVFLFFRDILPDYALWQIWLNVLYQKRISRAPCSHLAVPSCAFFISIVIVSLARSLSLSLLNIELSYLKGFRLPNRIRQFQILNYIHLGGPLKLITVTYTFRAKARTEVSSAEWAPVIRSVCKVYRNVLNISKLQTVWFVSSKLQQYV